MCQIKSLRKSPVTFADTVSKHFISVKTEKRGHVPLEHCLSHQVKLLALGVTAQVLFNHGYKSGLQLVVGKLTSFGVLQSYLRPTPVVIRCA